MRRSPVPKSESESSRTQRSESGLDVVDVPDRVLEALHWVRALQLREIDPGCNEIALSIEELLAPVPAVLAAAEQLAEVA